MARIRTIKPKFWDDLKVGRLSRDARLLYIGMWNFADDCGVIIGDLIWLKSKVFPYDQIQVQQFEKWIKELEITGFIYLFSYRDEEFIYLPTFSRHQVINKPNYEDLNIPKDVLDKQLLQITEQSRNDTGIITEQSIPIEEEEKDKEKDNISLPAGASECDVEFDKFWDLYDKKRGDKAKVKAKFIKLSKADRAKIFETLPAYVANTPDKKYRKDPQTYLNNRSWEDEIIPKETKTAYNPPRTANGMRLGANEWITADGRRTYGTGHANIPIDAPPRPSMAHYWDADSRKWLIL